MRNPNNLVSVCCVFQSAESQQQITKVSGKYSRRSSIFLMHCPIGIQQACENTVRADVTFYEYGKTWSVDTLIRLAITKNKAADFKRVNKLDFINTTVSENAAWTTYNLHSEITRNGKTESVHWLETVILVRHEKKWKISVLHSSLVKRN